MKPIRIVPNLLIVFLAACGGGGDAGGGGSTVRDSAGIQIVENRGGVWGEDGGWRLSEEPTLQIGVADGDTLYQLDGVRDAVRLGDGRIVVANGGSHQLRWYGADGRHAASAGREGGGPGEFRTLRTLRLLPGDSVLAYDLGAFRLSWFGPDGRFVRSAPLQPVGEVPPRFVDRFADGSMLLSSSVRTGGETPRSGMRRDTLLWLRADAAGVPVDSLPVTPGSEASLQILTQGGRVTGMNVMAMPFMRNVHTAAAGDRYWQGITDAYEIVLRRADGTPQRIVRRAVKPVPVRGAYLDSLRGLHVAEHGPEAGTSLDQVQVPARLPAFERLLVDQGGNLWVQQTTWPGAVPAAWDVFDGDGRLLGTVTMPAGFRATQIGADFVLGVWTDDVDVEYVRMYGLTK
ncbi:hypothetical protein [Longimicrobium sp.]|uniref:hypothetical protein n=1 Tax=Longimicrobium sp. TaxID=2029185 RepID=UPI003B3A13AA